jgi:hypothetical protein
MTGWRPIATAPRDGAEVILGAYDLGSFAGFWHDGRENHWKRAGWYAEMDRGGLLIARPFDVTHWMPLPNPPAPPRLGRAATIGVGAHTGWHTGRDSE